MSARTRTRRRRPKERRTLLIYGPYGTRRATWWDRLRIAIRRALR